MSYLIPGDYNKSIQADNLQQVIGSNPNILADAEQTAIEEIRSHLTQKYLLDQEFTDTPAWNIADTHYQHDRVYIDAPLFSATTEYPAGSYVTYQVTNDMGGKRVYYNAGPDPIPAGAFDATDWQFVAYQYTIFHVKDGAPDFNYLTRYAVGNLVYWKGKIYTCQIATSALSQEIALQYFNYQSIPLGNVFPDDPVNGVQYWGAGVAFSVPSPTQIVDTTKWVKADNRCKQVVWCAVVITLYYIHARIAPRNIPEIRDNDYIGALKKLKQFAEGDTTANLPVKQPRQGARVRYGGNVKNQNNY